MSCKARSLVVKWKKGFSKDYSRKKKENAISLNEVPLSEEEKIKRKLKAFSLRSEEFTITPLSEPNGNSDLQPVAVKDTIEMPQLVKENDSNITITKARKQKRKYSNDLFSENFASSSKSKKACLMPRDSCLEKDTYYHEPPNLFAEPESCGFDNNLRENSVSEKCISSNVIANNIPCLPSTYNLRSKHQDYSGVKNSDSKKPKQPSNCLNEPNKSCTSKDKEFEHENPALKQIVSEDESKSKLNCSSEENIVKCKCCKKPMSYQSKKQCCSYCLAQQAREKWDTLSESFPRLKRKKVKSSENTSTKPLRKTKVVRTKKKTQQSNITDAAERSKDKITKKSGKKNKKKNDLNLSSKQQNDSNCSNGAISYESKKNGKRATSKISCDESNTILQDVDCNSDLSDMKHESLPGKNISIAASFETAVTHPDDLDQSSLHLPTLSSHKNVRENEILKAADEVQDRTFPLPHNEKTLDEKLPNSLKRKNKPENPAVNELKNSMTLKISSFMEKSNFSGTVNQRYSYAEIDELLQEMISCVENDSPLIEKQNLPFWNTSPNAVKNSVKATKPVLDCFENTAQVLALEKATLSVESSSSVPYSPCKLQKVSKIKKKRPRKQSAKHNSDVICEIKRSCDQPAISAEYSVQDTKLFGSLPQTTSKTCISECLDEVSCNEPNENKNSPSFSEKICQLDLVNGTHFEISSTDGAISICNSKNSKSSAETCCSNLVPIALENGTILPSVEDNSKNNIDLSIHSPLRSASESRDSKSLSMQVSGNANVDKVGHSSLEMACEQTTLKELLSSVPQNGIVVRKSSNSDSDFHSPLRSARESRDSKYLPMQVSRNANVDKVGHSSLEIACEQTTLKELLSSVPQNGIVVRKSSNSDSDFLCIKCCQKLRSKSECCWHYSKCNFQFEAQSVLLKNIIWICHLCSSNFTSKENFENHDCNNLSHAEIHNLSPPRALCASNVDTETATVSGISLTRKPVEEVDNEISNESSSIDFNKVEHSFEEPLILNSHSNNDNIMEATNEGPKISSVCTLATDQINEDELEIKPDVKALQMKLETKYKDYEETPTGEKIFNIFNDQPLAFEAVNRQIPKYCQRCQQPLNFTPKNLDMKLRVQMRESIINFNFSANCENCYFKLRTDFTLPVVSLEETFKQNFIQYMYSRNQDADTTKYYFELWKLFSSSRERTGNLHLKEKDFLAYLQSKNICIPEGINTSHELAAYNTIQKSPMTRDGMEMNSYRVPQYCPQDLFGHLNGSTRYNTIEGTFQNSQNLGVPANLPGLIDPGISPEVSQNLCGFMNSPSFIPETLVHESGSNLNINNFRDCRIPPRDAQCQSCVNLLSMSSQSDSQNFTPVSLGDRTNTLRDTSALTNQEVRFTGNFFEPADTYASSESDATHICSECFLRIPKEKIPEHFILKHNSPQLKTVINVFKLPTL